MLDAHAQIVALAGAEIEAGAQVLAELQCGAEGARRADVGRDQMYADRCFEKDRLALDAEYRREAQLGGAVIRVVPDPQREVPVSRQAPFLERLALAPAVCEAEAHQGGVVVAVSDLHREAIDSLRSRRKKKEGARGGEAPDFSYHSPPSWHSTFTPCGGFRRPCRPSAPSSRTSRSIFSRARKSACSA